jgi:hypothetical protein
MTGIDKLIDWLQNDRNAWLFTAAAIALMIYAVGGRI